VWSDRQARVALSAEHCVLPGWHPERVTREHLMSVLGAFVGKDTPSALDVPLSDDGEWCFCDLAGRDVDNALQEAHGEGLIVGDRHGTGDSAVFWSNIRLTVRGLRTLGEWPPAGSEHQRGPWHERYWGKVPRPLLEELASCPPWGGFIFGPDGGWGGEDWQRWIALHRLMETGLVAGDDGGSGGVADVRVTLRGQDVLVPPANDPLADAEVACRQGSKETAMIAAIEKALGHRLKQLAVRHGVATADGRGAAKRLAVLNADLKAAGVYDEAERTQVEAWLKVRNEVGHGRAENVSLQRIEVVIAGVRVFLDEHTPN
jgi:hypothetical protein